MRCYRVTCWPVTHPGRLERLGRFRSATIAGAVAERLVSSDYAHEAAVYEVTDEGAPDEAPRAVACRQLAVFAAGEEA